MLRMLINGLEISKVYRKYERCKKFPKIDTNVEGKLVNIQKIFGQYQNIFNQNFFELKVFTFLLKKVKTVKTLKSCII